MTAGGGREEPAGEPVALELPLESRMSDREGRDPLERKASLPALWSEHEIVFKSIRERPALERMGDEREASEALKEPQLVSGEREALRWCRPSRSPAKEQLAGGALERALPLLKLRQRELPVLTEHPTTLQLRQRVPRATAEEEEAEPEE